MKKQMNRAWEHFKTITHHKLLVMDGCFRVGLFKQGLLHDLSKYSPAEFLVGAKYYQGDRSPNNAEREDIGYSSAWLHHKGRNRHHYEYWIDYSSRDIEGGMAPVPMPTRYVIEMFMDRIAACKVYHGAAYKDQDPLAYYQSSKRRPCRIRERNICWNFCFICWPNRGRSGPSAIFAKKF